MAANSAIGNVETMYLISNDSYDNRYETNISKGFTINQNATYQQIDTANRALTGLIKNSYEDTQLITRISVTEVLAE